MSNPTTSYGYELTPGDDAGHDDVPICCNNDMPGGKTPDGGIDFTCGSCGTVVEIDESGLVFDIREAATAR